MSGSSTYGKPMYGPFSDGTVQTYFRKTIEHEGSSNPWEYDIQLVKPHRVKDKVIDHYQIPLDKK